MSFSRISSESKELNRARAQYAERAAELVEAWNLFNINRLVFASFVSDEVKTRAEADGAYGAAIIALTEAKQKFEQGFKDEQKNFLEIEKKIDADAVQNISLMLSIPFAKVVQDYLAKINSNKNLLDKKEEFNKFLKNYKDILNVEDDVLRLDEVGANVGKMLVSIKDPKVLLEIINVIFQRFSTSRMGGDPFAKSLWTELNSVFEGSFEAGSDNHNIFSFQKVGMLSMARPVVIEDKDKMDCFSECKEVKIIVKAKEDLAKKIIKTIEEDKLKDFFDDCRAKRQGVTAALNKAKEDYNYIADIKKAELEKVSGIRVRTFDLSKEAVKQVGGFDKRIQANSDLVGDVDLFKQRMITDHKLIRKDLEGMVEKINQLQPISTSREDADRLLAEIKKIGDIVKRFEEKIEESAKVISRKTQLINDEVVRLAEAGSSHPLAITEMQKSICNTVEKLVEKLDIVNMQSYLSKEGNQKSPAEKLKKYHELAGSQPYFSTKGQKKDFIGELKKIKNYNLNDKDTLISLKGAMDKLHGAVMAPTAGSGQRMRS